MKYIDFVTDKLTRGDLESFNLNKTQISRIIELLPMWGQEENIGVSKKVENGEVKKVSYEAIHDDIFNKELGTFFETKDQGAYKLTTDHFIMEVGLEKGVKFNKFRTDSLEFTKDIEDNDIVRGNYDFYDKRMEFVSKVDKDTNNLGDFLVTVRKFNKEQGAYTDKAGEYVVSNFDELKNLYSRLTIEQAIEAHKDNPMEMAAFNEFLEKTGKSINK